MPPKMGKPGNPQPSTPATTGPPSVSSPAPSATASVSQATSAVASLQISNTASMTSTQTASATATGPANGNPATSSAAGSSGLAAASSAVPTRVSKDPNGELSKPVQELGVRRPPQTQTGAQPPEQVLQTNYFRVTLKEKKDAGINVLHEYQITGLIHDRPNDLSRTKKKVMIKRFIQQSPFLNAAGDYYVPNGEGRIIAWKNLDANTPVGGSVDRQDVPDYDRNQHGVVSQNLEMNLVYLRTIDLSALQSYAQGSNMDYPASIAEEAVNILLGRAVAESNTGAIQIGDNHFFVAKPTPLGGWGMVALRGFTSHVKARQGSLYLNVNTALSAFYQTGTVDEHIRRLAGQNYPLGFLNNPRAKQHLQGLRVRIRYDRDKPGEQNSTKDTPEGRLKSITGFSDKRANKIFFVDRSGNQVSVWTHFQNDHPAEASRSTGDQFCVNTSSTTPGRECWILSDQLDVVEGQIYRKTLDRLNPNMTAAMITLSCRRPHENQQSIERDGMRALGLTGNGPVRLQAAGITVGNQMITVPFRQIPQPAVIYGGKTVQPSNGQWSTRGLKFLSEDRKLLQTSSGIVFLCPAGGLSEPDNGPAYINGFGQAWQMNYKTQNKNIKVGKEWKKIPAPGMGDLSTITRTVEDSKAGLIVLALPSTNAQVRPSYANFRIVLDQIVGKPSLVLCEDRIVGSVKAGRQINGAALIPYMANNAMKVNVRLGNENHTTDAFASLSSQNGCNTLVLGADLIHPKATSSPVCPTIACVVGSVNGNFAKFLGSARRQEARTEIIDNNNMIAMATERIDAWRKANSGRLPARILYYRDGTGESQHAGILREVSAIKTAWENVAGLQRSVDVAVTAVVAVKRHTTRFYPVRNGQKTRTGNAIPGSVVNSLITHPYFFDFYLQSHDVEQGSAKPTHYYVLENGMNFSEKALHDLTNAFCYNFSHSASAVSYASPAYYADRLCERTSLYLREFFDNDLHVQQHTSDSVREAQMDIAWGRGGQGQDGNPWHKNFNSTMFWM